MPAAARVPRPAAPPPSSPAATVKNRKRKAAQVEPPKQEQKKETKRAKKEPAPAEPAANAGPKPRREAKACRAPTPPTRWSKRKLGRAPSPTPMIRLVLAALEVDAEDIVMYDDEDENGAGPSGTSSNEDNDEDVPMMAADDEMCVPTEPIEDLTTCPPEDALPCPAAPQQLNQKNDDADDQTVTEHASDKNTNVNERVADSVLEFVNESADTLGADETDEDSSDDDDCSTYEEQIYLPGDEDAEGEEDDGSAVLQSWPVPTPAYIPPRTPVTVSIPPAPAPSPNLFPPPGLRIKFNRHPCGRVICSDYAEEPPRGHGTPRTIPKQPFRPPRSPSAESIEMWRWLTASVPRSDMEYRDRLAPAPWVAWGTGEVCAQEDYMNPSQIIPLESASGMHVQTPLYGATPDVGGYGMQENQFNDQVLAQITQESYFAQREPGNLYGTAQEDLFASSSQDVSYPHLKDSEYTGYASSSDASFSFDAQGVYTPDSTLAAQATCYGAPAATYTQDGLDFATYPAQGVPYTPEATSYTAGSPSYAADSSYSAPNTYMDASTSYSPEMCTSPTSFDAYTPQATYGSYPSTPDSSYPSTPDSSYPSTPDSSYPPTSDATYTTPDAAYDPTAYAALFSDYPSTVPTPTSSVPFLSTPPSHPMPAQPLPGRRAGWKYVPRPRGCAPGTEGLMRVMARDLPMGGESGSLGQGGSPGQGGESGSPAQGVYVAHCLTEWIHKRLVGTSARPRRMIASPVRHGFPPLCASKLAQVVDAEEAT
ncbi:hypothetical protein BD626DRAFT_574919 [Schizophyllum amplum]|uniref:Uncharacterized protein n=1 Tax=Schizophyllum amplum TaxID=97359 RepID=A0A550BX32_9AGAR|nr:hypothetical protein BD626DRAFT_574919 [Auriculariopsis ampla]